MRKYIFITFLLLSAVVSCQKLDYPEADSSNALSSLKCFVYYDADNLRTYQELDVLSGSVNMQLGAISYTFPEGERFTTETLKNCRLEATIPSTARLIETDATGKDLGTGIGGMRDFSAAKTTIYFKVVAADGTEKRYQCQFQFNK